MKYFRIALLVFSYFMPFIQPSLLCSLVSLSFPLSSGLTRQDDDDGDNQTLWKLPAQRSKYGPRLLAREVFNTSPRVAALQGMKRRIV
jgi:hypothetical protein